MVGWTTLLALLVEKAWVLGESLPLKAALLSTAPMGPVIANMILGNGWKVHYLELALAVAAITHLALVAWYLVRFGRIANADVRSPQLALPLAGRPDWLAPPRRSWLSAIVWKQFRESGPIVAAGLAGVQPLCTCPATH